MRFIPAVSLVQIRLPLPFWPDGQAVKTPPFHGGNTGSIPVRVTTQRRCVYGRIAQLVRALASHARGQRFESVYAHQKRDSSRRRAGCLSFGSHSRIHDVDFSKCFRISQAFGRAKRRGQRFESVYAHQIKNSLPDRVGCFLFLVSVGGEPQGSESVYAHHFA